MFWWQKPFYTSTAVLKGEPNVPHCHPVKSIKLLDSQLPLFPQICIMLCLNFASYVPLSFLFFSYHYWVCFILLVILFVCLYRSLFILWLWSFAPVILKSYSAEPFVTCMFVSILPKSQVTFTWSNITGANSCSCTWMLLTKGQ